MARARFAASLTAASLLACTALPMAPAPSGAVAAPAPGAAAAVAAAACANASVTPRAGNLEVVREAVLCLVNREREAHGVSPLTTNPRLTSAAQAHSEDMASGDYFSHFSPSGESPLERMRASGYVYSSQIGYEVGENIAWGTLWLASPQSIVSAWMASPEHRANILDAGYRETGVGVSPHAPPSLSDGQAGGLYTQDFGTLFSGGHAARHPAAHRRAGPSAHSPAHPRTLSSERPLHRRSTAGSRRAPSHGRALPRARPRRGSDRGSFRRSRHRGSALHRRPRRPHRGGAQRRHRSAGRSGRITSGARTIERSHNNHGSPRRQVRHRHRVRARHRSRHRGTAHRARRAGSGQRP